MGVEQDEGGVTAIVDVGEGQEKVRIKGDYLVGADGASSGVRTALFGKEYPGETLPQQIVATNVSPRLSYISLPPFIPRYPDLERRGGC